ncbi:MAG: zf-TFIIB domain-containing protein [Gaiella sp.]
MTTTEPTTKQCPTCDAPLVELDRSGIHIDACPRCRGVWLDRGELDRIVERERRAAEPELDADFFAEMQGRGAGTRPADRSRDDRDDDRDERGGKRRRGGFLEELFDFGG